MIPNENIRVANLVEWRHKAAEIAWLEIVKIFKDPQTTYQDVTNKVEEMMLLYGDPTLPEQQLGTMDFKRSNGNATCS